MTCQLEIRIQENQLLKTGNHIRAELFRNNLAISCLGLLWLFLLHLLQTKRG